MTYKVKLLKSLFDNKINLDYHRTMIAKVNKEVYAVVSLEASDEVVEETAKRLESALYMFFQLGWMDNDSSNDG